MSTYASSLTGGSAGGGGSGVTSLNSETGAITLVGGNDITITPSGQNITIATTPDATKADISLDNLASTAVNASIVPAVDNSIDLGSSALNYSSLNVKAVTSSTTLTLADGVNSHLQLDNGGNVTLASNSSASFQALADGSAVVNTHLPNAGLNIDAGGNATLGSNSGSSVQALEDGSIALNVNSGFQVKLSGPMNLAGTSSGSVTVAVQASTGTYNFNIPTSAGSSGQVLTSAGGGSSPMTWTTTGTVTSVSVASANGFAGTVATATTTPAITVSTTVNAPALAGNGTAISAATTTGSGSTVVLSTGPTLTSPSLSSTQINNVADPTSAQQAATKNYVDTMVAALNPATAVYAATAGSNIPGTYVPVGAGIGDTFTTTATGTFTVDGTTPALACPHPNQGPDGRHVKTASTPSRRLGPSGSRPFSPGRLIMTRLPT